MYGKSVDPAARNSQVSFEKLYPQRAMMVSNNSKNAQTWMCGPQHEIKNQSIPGYTGFIPGIHAENVFSISYAKATGKSYAEKIVKGAEKSDKRYASMTQKKYNERAFRRILERPNDMTNQRDYLEYMVTVNKNGGDN